MKSVSKTLINHAKNRPDLPILPKPFSDKVIRKISVAILVGLFYWGLLYAVMKLFALMNLEYNDSVGFLFYYVIPFLLGALVIIIIRERRYFGIIYSALIIIIRYIITLIELFVSLPTGRNPLEETLWLFNIFGKYSMLIAMFGGLLAILINTKRSKIANSVRS